MTTSTTTVAADDLVEGMKIVNEKRPDVAINVTNDATPAYYHKDMVTVGTDMGTLYFPVGDKITIQADFEHPKRNVAVAMSIVRETFAKKTFTVDKIHFKHETGKDITEAEGSKIWDYLVEHEYEQVWDVNYEETDVTAHLDSISPLSSF